MVVLTKFLHHWFTFLQSFVINFFIIFVVWAVCVGCCVIFLLTFATTAHDHILTYQAVHSFLWLWLFLLLICSIDGKSLNPGCKNIPLAPISIPIPPRLTNILIIDRLIRARPILSWLHLKSRHFHIGMIKRCTMLYILPKFTIRDISARSGKILLLLFGFKYWFFLCFVNHEGHCFWSWCLGLDLTIQ